MSFIPPSKEEIRQKYGITEDDFEVLNNFPRKEEYSIKGGFFIKLASAFGFQEWMWKSWSGRVLGIVIVSSTVVGVASFLENVATYGYQEFGRYLQSFRPEDDKHNKCFVAFYPQTKAFLSNTQPPKWDEFPIGTGVFPASGKGFG